MVLEISFLVLQKSIKYIELTTALVGSIFYYKYNNTFLKYFLIILWFTAVNEFLGYFLHHHNILRNNSIIYNIYHFINFSFLFILLKNYVSKKKHKNWINTFLLLYIISFFANLFIQDYFKQVQTLPFIIGAILIVISIFFYFLEILNTDKVLDVSKNLLFWISVGLLLYFIGKIPTRMTRNYYYEITDFENIFIVEYMLSIVMNSLFIIGFICSEKDRQY